MSDPPKRLKPTLETVRYLFAHSGNVCAFDPCAHPLIDELGNFVGELCHIEAAEMGGERFKSNMTNEERRHRDNLMLMCHAHHVRTNDMERYPIDAMQRIKATHESQFAGGLTGVPEATFEQAVDRIRESAILDVTKQNAVRLPLTLDRFIGVISDGKRQTMDLEEREGSLVLIYPMLENLRKLPVDTRGVLLIMIDRAEEHAHDLQLPYHELQLVTDTEPDLLSQHVDLLQRYGIVDLWEDDGVWFILTKALGLLDYPDWPFWREVRRFCGRTGVSLERLIMDMRFDLLDEDEGVAAG
jgi:hypothetical protein